MKKIDLLSCPDDRRIIARRIGQDFSDCRCNELGMIYILQILADVQALCRRKKDLTISESYDIVLAKGFTGGDRKELDRFFRARFGLSLDAVQECLREE